MARQVVELDSLAPADLASPPTDIHSTFGSVAPLPDPFLAATLCSIAWSPVQPESSLARFSPGLYQRLHLEAAKFAMESHSVHSV